MSQAGHRAVEHSRALAETSPAEDAVQVADTASPTWFTSDGPLPAVLPFAEGGASAASASEQAYPCQTQESMWAEFQRLDRQAQAMESARSRETMIEYLRQLQEADRVAERGPSREFETDLVGNLTSMIAQCGQIRGRRTAEARIRIPCGVVGVVGRLELSVGRQGDHDYVVSATGNLGVGVLGPGMSSSVNAVIAATVEGHDPQTCAMMIAANLEMFIRRLDNAVSDERYQQMLQSVARGRRPPRAGFFNAIADQLFSNNLAGDLFAHLPAGRAARSGQLDADDRVDFAAGVSQQNYARGTTERLEAEAALDFGLTTHTGFRRGDDGGPEAIFGEDFRLAFSAEVGPVSCKLDAVAPLRGNTPGHLGLEIAFRLPPAGAGQRLTRDFVVDSLVTVLDLVLARLPSGADSTVDTLRAHATYLRGAGLDRLVQSVLGHATGVALSAAGAELWIGVDIGADLVRGQRPATGFRITPFIERRLEARAGAGTAGIDVEYAERIEAGRR